MSWTDISTLGVTKDSVGLDVQRLDDVQKQLLTLYTTIHGPTTHDPSHIIANHERVAALHARLQCTVKQALATATEQLLEDLQKNVKLLGRSRFALQLAPDCP